MTTVRPKPRRMAPRTIDETVTEDIEFSPVDVLDKIVAVIEEMTGDHPELFERNLILVGIALAKYQEPMADALIDIWEQAGDKTAGDADTMRIWITSCLEWAIKEAAKDQPEF